MNKVALHNKNISDLAKCIRKSELSPLEIAEHYLARIDVLNPQLKAYRSVCQERALGEARAAGIALSSGQDLGPLHGIPYAVKDMFDVKGSATSAGTNVLKENVALQDSYVVNKLAQAGMVLLGKTNTVQLAYGAVGINHDQCTPRNPWHRKHYIPGGSSSGSGVAVASGMASIALGTDTAGSVRIPASICGTVGLKPTFERISRRGVYPLSWSFDSVGVLSRCVEDSALVFQHIQGYDFYDEGRYAPKPIDVLKDLKSGVQGLRLAFGESLFWDDVEPEVENAVRECGKIFKDIGANVSKMSFSEAGEAAFLNTKGVILAAEAYTVNKELVNKRFGQLDPIVANRLKKAADIKASEYLQQRLDLRRLRARAAESMKDIDVLLVPTTVMPGLPITEVDSDASSVAKCNALYLRNTAIGNLLGMCGLSVPCGFTKEGLPIGLMLYGKAFREDVILRAGYAYEKASLWHTIRPELSWVDDPL